jgi:hypothetical protein
MAMPVSAATMVLDTDLTLTARSTAGPRNASAATTSPSTPMTRAFS